MSYTVRQVNKMVQLLFPEIYELNQHTSFHNKLAVSYYESWIELLLLLKECRACVPAQHKKYFNNYTGQFSRTIALIKLVKPVLE